MARVVLERLSKSFQSSREAAAVFAVQDLSLEVRDGELVVLVGPSGCGKSTTLRLIAGLEELTSGTIRIGDQVVNQIEPRHRDVAMVFQNYTLYPHLTAYENMALGLELRKISRAEIQLRVGQAAEMLALTSILESLPKELSGGQRQRVAVGRAIVRQPKVLLLDEPFSNLDAQMRQQMRIELARVHQQLKITMIHVTHDQAEAMTLGQRIVVLHQATLQQVSEPITLYQRPCNQFVAGFIGSPPMNFFPGRLEGMGEARQFVHQAPNDTAPPFRFPAPRWMNGGQNVIAGLRPEHLSTQPGVGTVQIEGTVELVELLGAETLLHLARGADRFVARLPKMQRHPIGAAVRLHADVGQCLFFDGSTGSALQGQFTASSPPIAL